MMKKLSLWLVAITLMSMPTAMAESMSGKYTLGASVLITGVGGGGITITDACTVEDVTIMEDCNFGGYIFSPHPDGLLPLTVQIADNSGGPVAYTVCQDADDDGRCSGGGLGGIDPYMTGCGTDVNLADSTIAFRADLGVTVFIRLFSDACPGIGSGGTITVFFE